VTLGILTGRPESDLYPLVTREAVAEIVSPSYCGDGETCDAVRATLRDTEATTLELMRAADWGGIDADASAASLSPAERASIPSRSRVVVITVAAATSPRQMPVRAAFAAAAAIAAKIDGLVHDPLLARLETWREFTTHVVTTPLDASAFRRDRIELLYEPKQPGVDRVLTAGLSRWGAPDVEAARVPTAARERVAEIVLAVAGAVADGAMAGRCELSRDDVGRARGQDYPTDADLPPVSPIGIDLVSMHPEAGDPNDFIARIEPAGGDGPLGYVDLAERFFGPLLTAPPPAEGLDESARLQRELAATLARWDSTRASGARLLVRLPFSIPGDAGVESMWVEVSAYDARTVTGKLVDEPLGATDVARGDLLTRPRSQVEDVRVSK
jgi:Uncharacterized protein conserved in bacteria (DUF2314)